MEEKRKAQRPGVDKQMLREGFADAIRLLRPMVGKFASPSGGVVRNDDGLGEGMDRLRCCGNGVVPDEAVPAFQNLKQLAGIE
jgi:DNA (cytosine-5)-methyltransferase 1